MSEASAKKVNLTVARQPKIQCAVCNTNKQFKAASFFIFLVGNSLFFLRGMPCRWNGQFGEKYDVRYPLYT